MRILQLWNKIAIAFCCAMVSFFATAQKSPDCEKVLPFLSRIENRSAGISTTNPEVINLHYLFVQDMIGDIERFRSEVLPQLHLCPEIDFYQAKRRCDTLEMRLLKLQDTLEVQRERVDTIFYLMAVDEVNHADTALAEYYLDRSLQFNRLQSYSLILKCRLLFSQEMYDDCIEQIHLLYNEAPLTRAQENELSDFTAEFYDHIFTKGDSLVKVGLAAEALDIFQTLETFCHDMPSSYCNDDYYRGIIRSKSGVYESYLTIAQVAWKRKNYDIAYKFLDYANDYREANPDEVEASEKFASFIEMMEQERWKHPQDEDEEAQRNEAATEADSPHQGEVVRATDTMALQTNVSVSSNPPEVSQEEGHSSVSLQPLPEPTPLVIDAERELAYARLFGDALYLLHQGDASGAIGKLQEAIVLEKCNCVTTDVRVRLLYEQLTSHKKGKRK